jgi:hypothetical protein
MGVDDASLFGIAATLVYTIFSANCSSPQTTELFAAERSGTLWKYVRTAGWQSAALVGVMAVKGRSPWPAIGGGITGALLWYTYADALRAGGGQRPPTGEPTPAGNGNFYVKGR